MRQNSTVSVTVYNSTSMTMIINTPEHKYTQFL